MRKNIYTIMLQMCRPGMIVLLVAWNHLYICCIIYFLLLFKSDAMIHFIILDVFFLTLLIAFISININ